MSEGVLFLTVLKPWPIPVVAGAYEGKNYPFQVCRKVTELDFGRSGEQFQRLYNFTFSANILVSEVFENGFIDVARISILCAGTVKWSHRKMWWLRIPLIVHVFIWLTTTMNKSILTTDVLIRRGWRGKDNK